MAMIAMISDDQHRKKASWPKRRTYGSRKLVSCLAKFRITTRSTTRAMATMVSSRSTTRFGVDSATTFGVDSDTTFERHYWSRFERDIRLFPVEFRHVTLINMLCNTGKSVYSISLSKILPKKPVILQTMRSNDAVLHRQKRILHLKFGKNGYQTMRQTMRFCSGQTMRFCSV